MKKYLVFDISYKIFISAKEMHVRFDKVDGFIYD